MTELFDGVLARGGASPATSGAAWVRAMLDVEAALAGALADVGLVPSSHAAEIEAACARLRPDPAALGEAARGSGNPVVPLVRELTAAVDGPAAGAVHRGATSQDVLDTAMVLVARRALRPLLADLRAAADAAAELAREHAATPVVGRTLLQQAVPTTLGLKAAGWMTALDGAASALAAVELPVQLGGAAGTLESLGSDGPAVLDRLAARLDLAAPAIPWHTDRGPVAALAGALGRAAVAVGKTATDVVLLAQTEVGEVSAGAGGSSTMPHKRNPVAAIAAKAGALPAPGLVATLLTAGQLHEHERAAGAWHAEWRPLTELLRTVGSATAWLAEGLAGLDVHPDALRANLARTGGLVVSERVTTALTPSLGRLAAHDLVTAAARSGRPLVDALAEAQDVLGRAELDELLDPSRGTAPAEALVRRALEGRRG